MKKSITLLFFVLLILFAASGCQPVEVNAPKITYTEPDLGVLAEEILKLGAYPEMIVIKENRLPKFYDIDADKLESFAVYLCTEAIRSDEIVLLRAKEMKDVEELQKKVETRLTAQKKSFDDYLPKEGEKIGKVIRFSSHRDLLFVISDTKYIDDITDHIETAYKPN